MRTCLIISGGDYDGFLPDIKYDYLIACDLGYDYATRLGLSPDLILGDFDSYDESKINGNIPVLKSPPEKDDTDTMLAIRYAMEHDYKHIILLCALGKRLDHMLSNIQSMAYIAKGGGVGEIISSDEHIRTLSPLDKTVRFNKRENHSFSLFSVTDECSGLCISGAKYSGKDITISNTFPLGQSNEWKDSYISVSIRTGILLVIESRLPSGS